MVMVFGIDIIFTTYPVGSSFESGRIRARPIFTDIEKNVFFFFNTIMISNFCHRNALKLKNRVNRVPMLLSSHKVVSTEDHHTIWLNAAAGQVTNLNKIFMLVSCKSRAHKNVEHVVNIMFFEVKHFDGLCQIGVTNWSFLVLASH